MKTKVKPEQLKLGDVLYFVSRHYLTKGVQKATVTTLSLKDGAVTFMTDGLLTSNNLNSWNMYVTRSELKAKRVYNVLVELHNRRELKWQKEKEIYEENLNNLVEAGKNYLGKTIMVRFKRKGVEESYYEKVTIDTLEPRYKKGEYSFSTKPVTNQYLTTREGKNWYFWSELDELKQRKENIEKRIRELENGGKAE